MTKKNKNKDEVLKKPYYPMPFRPGHTNIELYEESFVDKIGNKATITKANFTDKKGKPVEGYTLFVKWLED
jgi:hypothetical protein